jgi:hypothetical protein
MRVVHAARDEIEREEDDRLSPRGLLRKIGRRCLVKIRRVDVRVHDLGIDCTLRLYGTHDAAAHREHHAHESAPTAQSRRPPAQLAAIPSRDARLVERRVRMDTPLVALGDARGVVGDETVVLGVQIRTLDPRRQPVMDEIDDGLNSELEQPFQSRIRPREVPNAGRGIHAMPWNAVAHGFDAKLREQVEVFAPARVMLRELVLVERAAGSR